MDLVCPGCDRKNDDPKAESFRHYLILSWPKQLAIFALGWAGFQIIASFIQQIYLWSFQTQNPGCTQEDILKYAMSPAFQGPVNFISYGILFGILALLLWNAWKGFFSSFKHWQAYAWGVGGLLVTLMANSFYSVILNAILTSLGLEFQNNANESTLRTLIAAYPLLSVLIFGLVGPWCEEMAYRVGLFSFFSRFHKALGYVLSILIFALIHFGWNAIGTEDIYIELYNIPSYIIGGVVLAVAYDKGGIAASFTAHSLNNLLSIFLTMMVQEGA